MTIYHLDGQGASTVIKSHICASTSEEECKAIKGTVEVWPVGHACSECQAVIIRDHCEKKN